MAAMCSSSCMASADRHSFGLVGLGVYWVRCPVARPPLIGQSYRKYEDLRSPRVIMDHDEPEGSLVSLRQLRRQRKRWLVRTQQLDEIVRVRDQISFAIPWDAAEAALVEAQDMVADLTAAIAAVEELQLRKAKMTKCVQSRARLADAPARGTLSSSPSPSPSSTICRARYPSRQSKLSTSRSSRAA